jgi:hypothetical protein
MKKALTHIEILEEQGYKLPKVKQKIVESYLNKQVELYYDDNLKVWTESGIYIADLIDCNK